MFSKFLGSCQPHLRGLWQRLVGVPSLSPFFFRKGPLLHSKFSNTALNLINGHSFQPPLRIVACSRVTKFWAMKCKPKCPVGFLLQGPGLILEGFPSVFFSCSFLLVWTWHVSARAWLVILDCDAPFRVTGIAEAGKPGQTELRFLTVVLPHWPCTAHLHTFST